ncbi:MAG: spore cortex-lytic enzyme [Halothermotrichaceae bacterium]
MKSRKNKLIIASLLILVVIGVLLANITETDAAQPTISWGSRGNSVITLQRKLKQWGYYDDRVDGNFGQNTYLAIVNFQRKNRIHVDGVVGPETWGALGYRGTTTGRVRMASGGAGVSRSNDAQLIARLIHAEARGEPYEGQVAVAAVLLNRVDDPAFPNSVSGVIYQPLAFESVANGQFDLPPTAQNVKAARSALNGWDPTHGATFFWNPSKPVNKWIWSRKIVRRIGGHVFAQ